MRYFLFIDESGDHGLNKIDCDFPVFVLCGTLISELAYNMLDNGFEQIKRHFWGNSKVVFHSRDIRKCEKEFSILLDYDVKSKFYRDLNRQIIDNEYCIISSAIQKVNFLKQYGKLQDDVYEIALSFIIERAIFCLDNLSKGEKGNKLSIIIEKRGKKEDGKLESHFQKIRDKGTFFVNSQRIKDYGSKLHFRLKKDNVNGLQLADLIAYPIASHINDSKRANPAFDLIKPKIYSRNSNNYGLKIFP